MIHLRRMTEVEYQSWLAIVVADYAREKMEAGFFKSEEALQKSKNEFSKLLPDGIDTPDQYLYSIVDSSELEAVGMIWFARINGQAGPMAYIYDLMVYSAYRRRGYGEAAMHLLEEKVHEVGLDTIELNVFGQNRPARALYQKMGYSEAAITMNKKIT